MSELMPNWQWWSNWGVLGVLAFVVVATALYALREWWIVRRPHVIERQRLELIKEQKQSDLLETLRDTQVADRCWKDRQLAMTDQIIKSQDAHAADCSATRRIVERILAESSTGEP
jgi:hypothetical protein